MVNNPLQMLDVYTFEFHNTKTTSIPSFTYTKDRVREEYRVITIFFLTYSGSGSYFPPLAPRTPSTCLNSIIFILSRTDKKKGWFFITICINFNTINGMTSVDVFSPCFRVDIHNNVHQLVSTKGK